jgi:hypothetical protein
MNISVSSVSEENPQEIEPDAYSIGCPIRQHRNQHSPPNKTRHNWHQPVMNYPKHVIAPSSAQRFLLRYFSCSGSSFKRPPAVEAVLVCIGPLLAWFALMLAWLAWKPVIKPG